MAVALGAIARRARSVSGRLEVFVSGSVEGGGLRPLESLKGILSLIGRFIGAIKFLIIFEKKLKLAQLPGDMHFDQNRKKSKMTILAASLLQ